MGFQHFNIAITVILLAVFASGSADAKKQRFTAPEVRIHPVTREEYNALLRVAQAQSHVTEGRLITSGLAAIKGLAVGLTTGWTANVASGLLPGLFNNLVHRNSDGDNKNSNDPAVSADVDDEPPLCVIATDEAAKDSTIGKTSGLFADGLQQRAPAPQPIVSCVVVVKKREGEDITGAQAQPEVDSNQLQDVPWYFNPYADPYAAARLGSMSWYGEGMPQSLPYYPPYHPAYYPYPYGYPMPEQRSFRKSSGQKSKRHRPSSRSSRRARALKLPPPRLAHKFSTEQQQKQQAETGEEVELVESPQQDQPSAMSPNELPNVAYRPVYYPQAGYPSNYPKVAYAHPLNYQSPVYVPSSTAVTPKASSQKL